MYCGLCVKGLSEGIRFGVYWEWVLGGEFCVDLFGDVSVSSFVNGVIIFFECVFRKFFEVKLVVLE